VEAARTEEGTAAARTRRAARRRAPGTPSAAAEGTAGSAERTAHGSAAAATAGTAGSAEEGKAGSAATAGMAGSAAAAGTPGAGSPPRRSWRTRPSGTLLGDHEDVNLSANSNQISNATKNTVLILNVTCCKKGNTTGSCKLSATFV
jgi:hypothetical protein